MSTTVLMVAPGFTSLQIKPCFRSQSFIANLDSCSANSKHKDGSWFGGVLRWRDSDSKRSMVVYSSVEPGTQPPNSNPNPNSWKSWVLSAIITIILPFFTHKWGPLFKITKTVEATVETVEQLTEVIEKVAEGVEDLADDFADKLPEGGKLRHAIETVENAAKETVKGAEFVGHIIDKVQEVKQEVESYVNDEGGGTAKESTDQKEEKEG
ncbi:Protein Ycf2 like [Actinidia chinensis var. chinensis]|uniref:Protein Ycf2 like n=1 Tax=Actinidia chinensis var. chinensis TaxID=1590841 RepID=A0A2R6QYA3_ACTCC|nr:Protein Ycf2 like [Actinidia chinensis var. chinensis]